MPKSSPHAANLRNGAQIAFYLILLVIGIVIYRDYGISWDERNQRTIGGVSLKYVVGLVRPELLPSTSRPPAFDQFTDRVYGVAFELSAAALEVLFRIKDERDVYRFRHLLTFLVALSGIYAVHLMAKRRFGKWWIGLLAALFLVLTPRLFAESFYNSKDIVFMAIFAIAMNSMIACILRPSTRAALLHALATAVAIDIRVMAIVLPVATLALLVVRPLRREASIAETIRVLAIYFAAVCVLVPAMWPWLWSDPIGHFAEAIKSMSHFRWDGEVLYLGRFIRSDALPWHYILVWILVTTPLLYLGLFLLGAIPILNRIARCGVRLWKSDEELQDIVFLGLFITPVIAVVALQSVLYDGWRHVYFVYPAFIFVAIGGWVTLWGWNRRTRSPRYLLGLATLISTIHIAVWMWRAHPFQNVYFNSFAGSNLKTRFELDYWGLANVKALKFILAHDPSEVVNVRAGSFMNIPIAFKMIDPKDRPRLRYSNDENTPHFLITNFRLVRDPDSVNYSEYYEPVYQVLVGDEVILSVYRSRVEAPAHHVDHCQENWRLGRGYSCLFIP